jgi:hypothetical protein
MYDLVKWLLIGHTKRNNMYEKDLKRIVCLFPELIEEGLQLRKRNILFGAVILRIDVI